MPCFAVAAVYGGEQNGLNQIYYFRTLSSEIIYSRGNAFCVIFSHKREICCIGKSNHRNPFSFAAFGGGKFPLFAASGPERPQACRRPQGGAPPGAPRSERQRLPIRTPKEEQKRNEADGSVFRPARLCHGRKINNPRNSGILKGAKLP